MENNPSFSRLNHREPTKQYAAEAFVPVVAANPTLIALLPLVVGVWLGLGMIGKGINGLTSRDQLEYGYGFGHLLQVFAGMGIVGAGGAMTVNAWGMAENLGPSVMEWAPVIQYSTTEPLAEFISNNLTFLIVGALAVGALTWWMTGGPTRELDKAHARSSKGKSDLARILEYN